MNKIKKTAITVGVLALTATAASAQVTDAATFTTAIADQAGDIVGWVATTMGGGLSIYALIKAGTLAIKGFNIIAR